MIDEPWIGKKRNSNYEKAMEILVKNIEPRSFFGTLGWGQGLYFSE